MDTRRRMDVLDDAVAAIRARTRHWLASRHRDGPNGVRKRCVIFHARAHTHHHCTACPHHCRAGGYRNRAWRTTLHALASITVTSVPHDHATNPTLRIGHVDGAYGVAVVAHVVDVVAEYA